jgi:peptidoglycan/LPS O-acetylase OafA/YrhL
MSPRAAATWQISHGDWAALTAIRGLAACYVMLSHIWFQVWPAVAPPFGYGATPDGVWLRATGWLYYGHYAVVVFIVLSGFSLAASCRMALPRAEVRAFVWRRFMRIGPPYYAALVFSCAVIWMMGDGKTGSQWDISVPVTAAGLVSHIALLQDFVESTQINYAMWSVAAEFHLYLCFPFLLRVCANAPWWSLVLVYGIVYGSIAWLAPLVGADFPVAYLGLCAHFYAGIWACRQRMRGGPMRRSRVMTSGVALLCVLIAVSVSLGFDASERWLAWLDGLCAAGAVLLLWGVTGRTGRACVSGAGVWRGVGEFSYSLYLTHAPVIFILWSLVSAVMSSPPWIWVSLSVIGPPVCLGFARLFHRYFEAPFVNRRRPARMCAANLNQ